MSRVLLLTVHPPEETRARGGYLSLLQDAEVDRYKIHRLVEDPDEADIILFAEIDTGRLCEYVLRHPYIKRYRSKCFMFSTDWRVIPFLPGIYTSVEKLYYLPSRVRPGFYPTCLINPLIKFEPDAERDLLYSFMGDLKTHPIRAALAALDHPPGAWVDTSAESQAVMWKGSADQRELFWQRYVSLLRRSKFVLCPRGVAPSSIRMFETMCMGRVPVVLSDEWVPPIGPVWDEFILRVPEEDVALVPGLLRERESEAQAMGVRGRQAWEEFFSEPVLFHRVVEFCLELQRGRKVPEWLHRQLIIPQLLRPKVLKEYWRYYRGKVRGEKY